MATVAFIACNEQFGGSEYLWLHAAAALASRGVKVQANVPEALTKTRGIELIRKCVPDFSTRQGAARREAKWKQLFRTSEKEALASWLAAMKPSLAVISNSMNFDGAHWGNLCHSLGIPFVFILQAAGENLWPGDPRYPDLPSVIRAYEHAAHSYFVSEHNWRLTERQAGMPIPRASVARNTFNVPFELPPWPQDDGVYRIACVARVEAYDKGIDLLLNAFARPKWAERPVHLSFYGTGKDSVSLEELRKYLGVRNASFEGHSNAVQEIWKRNQLLVLPSRKEGLPLALVETMICGRAAVVTDAGGNAEVMLDGATGFVAKAPTVDFLDEALERAWTARDSWEEMGRRAGEHIRTLVPADPAAALADSLETFLRP